MFKMRDPGMSWFRDHVGEAKAVMIGPRILQAGLIVGGSAGSALVIAHNRSGTGWNGPAFYRMATGSLGLQAGAQETEMVALIMTDKALNSLLSTSFKIGGDVSVAAGPIGVGTADYGRAATPVDILVTHSVSNPYGASLVRMVSHAVAEGR